MFFLNRLKREFSRDEAGCRPNERFAAEYDRLQNERVAAFSEFVADVNSGAYPEDKHIVHMDPAEMKRFMERIG